MWEIETGGEYIDRRAMTWVPVKPTAIKDFCVLVYTHI
jgi:hypothetical protein